MKLLWWNLRWMASGLMYPVHHSPVLSPAPTLRAIVGPSELSLKTTHSVLNLKLWSEDYCIRNETKDSISLFFSQFNVLLLLSSEWKLIRTRLSLSSSLLYLQNLTQCLVCNSCSIHICWTNKSLLKFIKIKRGKEI